MAYANPIHYPIHPEQVSSFSTLGLSGIQCPPAGDNRLHVPILEWTPSSKWKSVMGRNSSGRAISFNVSGAPVGYGAPIGDLTAYSNNMLSQIIKNGNDVVFSGAAERRIILRICVSFV